VHIEPSFELFVPNTFTPDGDYYNNTFFAQGFGISDDDFIFRIFNRWGDLIFESFDINEGWEGTDKKNLNKAQDGTYTWKIQFNFKESAAKTQETGHVNLLR
jgi:gliding motility-associated-like protein